MQNPPPSYRLLIRGVSPLLLAYTLWRSIKDGGMVYLYERLGIYTQSRKPAPIEPSSEQRLWVHAASVGEVITVMPLIQQWLKRKKHTIVFTTNTPTGKAVLEQYTTPGILHFYLPLDFPGATKRFLKTIQCHQGWIVETEIWPWLYAQSSTLGVPLTIINGRLSAKTVRQEKGFLAESYRQALKNVRILARTNEDKNRYLKLGAMQAQVSVAGNLKYSFTETPTPTTSLITAPYVLLASTHDDEEQRIAKAWLQLTDSKCLLVIAPRHPDRGGALVRQLSSLTGKIVQRSTGEPLNADCDIYIADTLGELESWYQHAMGCFVGGSLIERGGHNVLEPARYGCPTIVGPFTDNFLDEIEQLTASNAIVVVENADLVAQLLQQAYERDHRLLAMGQRAKQFSNQASNILPTYIALLTPSRVSR